MDSRNNNNGNHTQHTPPPNNKGHYQAEKSPQSGPRWGGDGGPNQQNKRRNNNNKDKRPGGGGRGRGDGRRGKGDPGDGRRGGKGGEGRGGRITEENAIVKMLLESTKGYFERIVIESVLKENDNSFEKTLSTLNAMKTNSWSAKVKHQEPFSPIPPAPAPAKTSLLTVVAENPPQPATVPHNTNGAQAHPKSKKNNNKKPAVNVHVEKQPNQQQQDRVEPQEPRTPPEEEYNADAKIEALQKQFENELRGIEAKKQLLTALKEEVATFTAERDSQIDTLTKEREQLCINRKALEQELLIIQGRVEQIDTAVAHLKQEKVQKIRILEEKSKAVLEDK